MAGRILHIAKNIPSPYKRENDIILKLIAKYSQRYGVRSDIIYPMEYMPRIHGAARFSKKLQEKMRLRHSFNTEDGLHVDVLRYFRLPGRKLANALTKYINAVPGNAEVLKKYIRSSYDVVHSHHVLPDAALAGALAVQCKKHVITVRQGDVNKIAALDSSSRELALYKRCLQNADVLVAPNHSIAEFTEGFIGREVKIIPHGCDVPSRLPAKQVNDPVVKVVTSAQLIPRKNIHWVLEAINEYCGPADVELMISGSGPLFTKLASNAGKRVTFLGDLEFADNMRLLAESDIFALPSEGETFGRVYIEALSYGLTCIGLRGTGLDGYDLEDTVAFPADYCEFRDVLHRYINNCADVRRNRDRCHGVALAQFEWRAVLERYQALYSS